MEEFKELIKLWWQRKACKKRELLSLVGKLSRKQGGVHWLSVLMENDKLVNEGEAPGPLVKVEYRVPCRFGMVRGLPLMEPS